MAQPLQIMGMTASLSELLSTSNIILVITFGAFLQACLSYFLDYCFERGSIFYNYYTFITKYFAQKANNDLYDSYDFNDDIPSIEQLASTKFWYKPLGGCIYCMNIWLSLVSFLFAYQFISEFYIPLQIGYSVLSHYILTKL